MPLTAAEQYYLELLNRARLDPAAEAARYGIDLNAGLAPGTLDASSRPVLAANELLNAAAAEHSQWMLATDTFSHTGAAGSTPGQRMSAEGYSFNGNWTWGENIAWSGTTGSLDLAAAIAGHHAGLFRSAGHRTNTLNGSFVEVGIGQEAGQFLANGTNWNASMLTTVFARSGGTVFVTGVAYVDRDNDDFYSIGEGRGGVVMEILGGSSITIDAAGGYALGTTASSQTGVRISHGSFVTDVTLDTSQGNAKLDLVGDTLILTSASLSLLSGRVVDVRLLGLDSISAEGNQANNSLFGNAGHNTLGGRSGADSLYGGDGNDVLLGGAGADRLDGGTGTRDRAQYSDAASGVLVDLLTPAGNTGIAAGDSFVGVEDLYGSDFADTLFGDSGGNMVWGALGDDVLYGRVGPDQLYGGDGNDILLGGAGADVLDGGAGVRDRVQYSDATAGLRADLQTPASNTGFAAGDGFAGIEDLHGSTFNDTLFGDAGGNILWGAAGNDALNGRGGADTLQGGTGNDVLTGGVGIDHFVFNSALGATNVDQITDFVVADDTIRLENAIFTALAATGTLAGTAFALGAATTAAHRIVYNSATGQVFYDSNGNAAGGSTLFATLTPGLALTAADFLVM